MVKVLGVFLGKKFADQSNQNRTLAHQGGIPQNLIFPIERIKVDQVTVTVRKDDYSNSNSLILGHPVNGKLGAPYLGMGGGQIVTGDDGNIDREVLVMDRVRVFDTEDDFADWTLSPKISTNGGYLR